MAPPDKALDPHRPDNGDSDTSEVLSQRVRSLRLPEDTDGPAWGPRLAWGLCLVFATSTAVLGYVAYRRGAGTESSTPPSAADASADVSTAPSGDVVLEQNGYLVPARRILVSPKVAGMIRSLKIMEGQKVTKGQVLAELEDTDYRADYERMLSMRDSAQQRFLELSRGSRDDEVRQSRAELAESLAQLAQLKDELNRSESLRQKRVLPEQDYEAARTKYWAMYRRVERLQSGLRLMQEGPRVERVEAAQADVRQAEAELAKAKWRLENCTIRAPVSGTILDKKAEEGNIVNPMAFNVSSSVCELADLSDMEVDLSIQERDVSAISEKQKCRIRPVAFPDRNYEGHVSRLMPIADRGKGSISVRVKVIVPSNEEGVYLKPEMAVTVWFLKSK